MAMKRRIRRIYWLWPLVTVVCGLVFFYFNQSTVHADEPTYTIGTGTTSNHMRLKARTVPMMQE